MRGVHRRVEGEQLVAQRQLVAVLLDERADVVALERHREPGERPGRRVARRERVGVVVDRDRFVVPGHHHHAVVRLALDRALRCAASRSRGTGRRRARCRGRSRSRRSRSQVAISDSRRCTGRSNRIAAWTSRSPSRSATSSASAATSRRRRSRRARPLAWEEARCPTDLLREMGALGPARHADPRGVGRHRHVDRRLRRRDGADRPGRPVGRRRVAGPRDHRLAAAATCSATTSSASAGCDRWPRDACSARSG